MKDSITLASLHEDALKALNENRLLDALFALDGLSVCLEDAHLKDKIILVRTSYGMLLDYMERGVADQERDKLYHRFVRECFEMTDHAYREYLLCDGTLHYTTVWRTLEKMQPSTSLTEVIAQNASYRLLFEMAWTGPAWQTSDYEAATQMATEQEADVANICILVSGATLGALQVFDALRLKFIVEQINSSHVTVRIRAIVGMAMICLKHRQRLVLYPALTTLIEQLTETTGISAMMQTLQIQLLLTLETQDIERCLREEIIPEVMKKAQEAKADKGISFEELEERMAEQEFNPEWVSNEASSTLAKKMHELTEMQQKGADVFMGSFKMLKKKFPFFNIAANWFLPFSTSSLPEQGEFLKKFPLTEQILNNGNLCDSDKFSFCLFLKELPPIQNEIIQKQFGQAMGNLPTDALNLKDIDEEKDASILIRSYVQDLYRFYHLFHYRCTNENPFRSKLLLTEVASLHRLMSSPNTIRTIADFAFTEKNYLYALPLYSTLPEDAEIFERIGFCLQSMGQFAEATQAYEKANLLKPDCKWTIRQLAYCYRKQGNFRAALHYYEELETHEPEKINVLLCLSECYLHFNHYDKAFEKLHKADYLSPQTGMAVKALVWCSLLTGKLEQAERYSEKVLEANATATDFLNAGHIAWLQGKLPKAIEYYRQSLKLRKLDHAPADFFEEDAPVLKQQGISQTDLSIMVDLLNKKNY